MQKHVFIEPELSQLSLVRIIELMELSISSYTVNP